MSESIISGICLIAHNRSMSIKLFAVSGVFQTIIAAQQIAYFLDDDRKVTVMFSSVNNKTHVVESFESENINPILNDGPVFKFNEAISFQVFCETQEKTAYYWDKLTAGGEEG